MVMVMVMKLIYLVRTIRMRLLMTHATQLVLILAGMPKSSSYSILRSTIIQEFVAEITRKYYLIMTTLENAIL